MLDLKTEEIRGQALPFAILAVQPAEPGWQLWTTQETLAQACLNFRFGLGLFDVCPTRDEGE